MAKKKLLFIIYTHSLGGGAEAILTNIVNHLDPTKYEIDLLEYAQYSTKTETINANIHRLPPIVSMSTENKIIRLIKNILVFSFPMVFLKKRKKYDLEISFNYLIPTFLLSNQCHSIAWIHGSIEDLDNQPYYRTIQRRALKHVDKIVAISERTYNSIIKTFPEFKSKVQIIYNGFNFSKIRELSLFPSSITVKQPAVCFVGRLDVNKNPLALLNVVKRLFDKGHSVNVYFLGEGIQRDEIINRAESYGIQEHVFLLGYQDNPYPIMSQCHAICMMSKSEGFPTVFAESMAMGIPFVTTPVGGVIELSNHGQCGYIINSIEECANAIEELVFNTEKWEQMSSACIDHVQEFDLTKQIEKIELLIDETVK